MPGEKAPGPDGFIGIFFKTAWSIIKRDIIDAINLFYSQHRHQLNLLNSGSIVLIPKHAEATKIGDYRPISPTHSIAKIISIDGKQTGTALALPGIKKPKCFYQNKMYS